MRGSNRSRIAFLFFPVIAFILQTVPSSAQTQNSGRGAFDFLKISPVSRAVGTGGAYTAMGDDVGAVYYNPAGLASLLTSELNFTYLALYQDMSYEFIAFAYPLGQSAPDIGGTLALSVHLLQPGSGQRTNDFGVTTGTYSGGDQVYSFSYARAFGALHAGALVKMISQQVDTVQTSLFAADLGIVVLPPFEGMRVGLSVKNLAATADNFDLPLSLNGGISYRQYEMFDAHDDGALTLEGTLPLRPIEDEVGMRVGGEYNYKWVGGKVSIRAGYGMFDVDLKGMGLTLGAGFGFDLVGATLFLDYAYAPADFFGNAHRLSLTTKF